MPFDTKSETRVDLSVYLAIALLGALEFAFSCHAPDCVFDTNYIDLANSLASGLGYTFDYKPMTQLPPGLPYLLAAVSSVVGVTYAGCIHFMTSCTTLALIASYKLLRFNQGRAFAAVCCLLFGTSKFLFSFSTTMVFADMPYFFTSILLLCLASSLDRTTRWRAWRTVIWLSWGALLVGTVLMRSAAISLLWGMLCWIAVSFYKDRTIGWKRARLFLPFVIAALAAEAAWMSWAARHQFHEWPLPGQQEHYVAQLRLKDANYPELGLATWQDVIARPVRVADDMAAAMLGLFAHKEMAPAWYSPGTVIPLILIVMGLGWSLRLDGGSLLEWYFISYMGMFLLWPWAFELRFLLPVAPIAFLYLWRGLRLVWRMARDRPVLVRRCGLLVTAAGCLSCIGWGRSVAHPQMALCIAIWCVVAGILVGISLPWQGRRLLAVTPFRFSGHSLAVWQCGVAVAVTCACGVGVASQLKAGARNLTESNLAKNWSYPDIEAATWIKAHSNPAAVIMARKEDIVFHYSHHRVIWFPPSHDVALLMAGIYRYRVQFVVVRYGEDTYWQPTAQECFGALSSAFPASFRLVHSGPRNSVYEVLSPFHDMSCLRCKPNAR